MLPNPVDLAGGFGPGGFGPQGGGGFGPGGNSSFVGGYGPLDSTPAADTPDVSQPPQRLDGQDRPSFLLEPEHHETFGTDAVTAPPVIGE